MFRFSGNKKLRRRPTGLVLNVKVSRQRRMKKFFSSSALKKGVVLVSFTALGVFGVIASAQGLKAFFHDPRYRVSEIAVYNQHFFTQKELLDMSGIAAGMYPFDFSVKKAAREIEKNPNVKRASVERVWPSKVVVKVIERSPVAILSGRRNFMIDEEGVVLPMRAEVPAGAVTIAGAEVTEEMVGQNLSASNEGIARAISLLREYHHTDLPLTLEFAQVDVSNPRNLVVRTRRGIRVLAGEGDYARRLSRLNRVLQDLSRRGKAAETVDLRFRDVVVQPVAVRGTERGAVERGVPAHLPAIRVEGR